MTQSRLAESAGSVREQVRQGYARVARASKGCGCDCGGSSKTAEEVARTIGYSDEDIGALPEGANLGVGCGNPTALAEIRSGETVLDLGSGAGIDCFLAASAVGNEGRVIGVDMTDEMLEAARHNAQIGRYRNVEFRKGLIEDLPVEAASVDLIISNCVINLSPEKDRVFAEAFRVLKAGGRMMISDIVLDRDLPAAVASSLAAYIGCVAGATRRDEYLRIVREAGFRKVEILSAVKFADALGGDAPIWKETAERLEIGLGEAREWAFAVISIKLRAVKPADTGATPED